MRRFLQCPELDHWLGDLQNRGNVMRISRLFFAAGAVCVLPFTITEVTAPQSADVTGQAVAAACDGSIKSATDRRHVGERVARGGLLATLASFPLLLTRRSYNPRNPSAGSGRVETAHYLLLTGVAAHVSGVFVASQSSSSASAWDDALQHLTVGQATAREVETCLGSPTTRSSTLISSGASNATDDDTSWEYRARTRNSFFGKSLRRVVTISFRDSIVSGIKVSETRQ
jgi:hypothetical protein